MRAFISFPKHDYDFNHKINCIEPNAIREYRLAANYGADDTIRLSGRRTDDIGGLFDRIIKEYNSEYDAMRELDERHEALLKLHDMQFSTVFGQGGNLYFYVGPVDEKLARVDIPNDGMNQVIELMPNRYKLQTTSERMDVYYNPKKYFPQNE